MSEIGRKFKIVLESLEDWGNEYIEYLEMREKEETGIEQSE